MSFLDELKRQAQARLEQQSDDAQLRAQRIAITEQACEETLRYLRTLADQLEVLRPTSHAVFQLDRKHRFERLPMSDFYVDARRRPLDGEPVFDHLLLHWQLKTGQVLKLVKDFPNEIEQLEARLRQAAVDVEPETVRNHDTGKLIEVRYTVQADFRASVRVIPRHEQQRLEFVLNNLDGLECITGWLPAEALSTERLDELARWLVGQPHRFLDGLRELRRTDA